MGKLIDEEFAKELLGDVEKIINILKKELPPVYPKKKDFEDFLQTKHAEQYTGLDDGMPEDYEDWLQDLDICDVIKWANEWGNL